MNFSAWALGLLQTLDVLYLSAWAVDIASPYPQAFVRFLSTSGMSAHSAHERFRLSIMNDNASLYLSMPRARVWNALARCQYALDTSCPIH